MLSPGRIIPFFTAWFLAAGTVSASGVPAYAASYALDTSGNKIDMGSQPLAYPVGVLGELMRRDKVFATALAKRGHSLAVHRFFKGADAVPLLGSQQLEAVKLGDMAAISAIFRQNAIVAGLAKQTFSTLVATKGYTVDRLKGRKIGYAPGSSAHYTLLEALASAGLSDKDVTLVDININDMPDALAKGKIDAFSAWEPAPTIAMSKNPQFGGIFRGLNANYLVIDAEWLARDPDDVKHMLASLIRAVNWMRTSRQNLRQAVEWAIGAEERFTGKKSSVTPEQAMNITQRELLDIVSAPLIPAVDATNRGPLYKQLEFLKKLGKLPADATWEKLQNGVRSELMKEVFSKAGQYQLKTFDYEK